MAEALTGTTSDVPVAQVLDIIRTFMCRGLIRAQAETGDRAAFWVPR